MKSSPRSPLNWIARIGLASIALIIGYFGVVSSVANTIKKSDPALAYQLAPYNGVLVAAYAQQEFGYEPSAEDGSFAAALARKALLLDGTAVEALNVLAFQAQLAGRGAQSDAIFANSMNLSRRELRPQLWGIEEAVSMGDIDTALRNYDIALRTSKDAKELLFPTLTSALSESRIRTGLLSILITEPVWDDDFFYFAANSGVNPLGVTRLFLEASKFDLSITDDNRTSLVNSLASQNKYQEAWIFFSSFREDATRRRSRDFGAVLGAQVNSVFDWSVTDQPNISAAILKDGRNGLADFFVPPSVGGVILQQTQVLPPGLYRLEGTSAGIEQPSRSRPYWALSCLGGNELSRVQLPNSSENTGTFSGQFSVPQNCPVQILQLIALPSDKASGLSGQIQRVRLVSSA